MIIVFLGCAVSSPRYVVAPRMMHRLHWCISVIQYLCVVMQAAGSAAAAGLNTSTYAEAIATAYAVGGAQAQVMEVELSESGMTSMIQSKSL